MPRLQQWDKHDGLSLHCAVEKSVAANETLGQLHDRLIAGYGFNTAWVGRNISRRLMHTRPMHEFGHVFFAIATAQDPHHPLPFEHGANGNDMAEVLTIIWESMFDYHDSPGQHPSFRRFLTQADYEKGIRQLWFNESSQSGSTYQRHIAMLDNITPALNDEQYPTRLFRRRHTEGFIGYELDDERPLNAALAAIPHESKWGEAFITSPKIPQPMIDWAYRKLKAPMLYTQSVLAAYQDQLPTPQDEQELQLLIGTVAAQIPVKIIADIISGKHPDTICAIDCEKICQNWPQTLADAKAAEVNYRQMASAFTKDMIALCRDMDLPMDNVSSLLEVFCTAPNTDNEEMHTRYQGDKNALLEAKDDALALARTIPDASISKQFAASLCEGIAYQWVYGGMAHVNDYLHEMSVATNRHPSSTIERCGAQLESVVTGVPAYVR